MWVAPKMLHMVCKSSNLSRGNPQWVRLRGVQGANVEVMNIYAPFMRKKEPCYEKS